jgi:hypothetical protein
VDTSHPAKNGNPAGRSEVLYETVDVVKAAVRALTAGSVERMLCRVERTEQTGSR